MTAGRAVVLEASGVLSPEELLQLFAPVDLSCFFGVAFEVLLVLTDDVTKTRAAIAIARLAAAAQEAKEVLLPAAGEETKALRRS